MTESVPSPAAHPTPSSQPVFRRVLTVTALVDLALLVVAGIVGGILSGRIGVLSAVIGAVMALVFLGLTAASILVANRFAGDDLFVPFFFAIVLGTWLVKFVLFLVVSLLLRDQDWIDPVVLFLTVIVGVLASLIADMVVVLRSRIPYTGDVRLPGE